MAKDGEEVPWVQPLPVSSHSYLGRHLYEVADTVIEAEFPCLQCSNGSDQNIPFG